MGAWQAVEGFVSGLFSPSAPEPAPVFEQPTMSVEEEIYGPPQGPVDPADLMCAVGNYIDNEYVPDPHEGQRVTLGKAPPKKPKKPSPPKPKKSASDLRLEKALKQADKDIDRDLKESMAKPLPQTQEEWDEYFAPPGMKEQLRGKSPEEREKIKQKAALRQMMSEEDHKNTGGMTDEQRTEYFRERERQQRGVPPAPPASQPSSQPASQPASQPSSRPTS
ncbi:MAG: hypothetical protein ACKV2T_26010 [Kofleriaceae bacterium]